MNCATFNRVIEWTPAKEARFWGFDTFEGLPEAWMRRTPQGWLKVARARGDPEEALKIERRSTNFLDCMKTQLRARISLRKRNDSGRAGNHGSS